MFLIGWVLLQILLVSRWWIYCSIVGQGDGWVFEEEKKKRGREICEGGRDRFNVNKLYEIHVTIGDEGGA